MIKKGEIIKLEIVDYAFVGKGIAKLKIEDRDYIVFVQHGIKGQIVNVKINKRKPKYAEGSITEIIQHSPLEKTTQVPTYFRSALHKSSNRRTKKDEASSNQRSFYKNWKN